MWKFFQKNLSLIFNVLILLAWGNIWYSGFQNNFSNFEPMVKEAGELAWMLILFTIFVSLIQKLIATKWPRNMFFRQLLPLRKSAGIMAFLILISHMAFELAKRGIGFLDFSAISNTIFSTDHAMLFGTIGFLFFVPVFFTSHKLILQKMGAKNWKLVQKLTHAGFIFGALHIALIHYFDRGFIEFGPIVLLAVYLLGYAYLFWKKNYLKSLNAPAKS